MGGLYVAGANAEYQITGSTNFSSTFRKGAESIAGDWLADSVNGWASVRLKADTTLWIQGGFESGTGVWPGLTDVQASYLTLRPVGGGAGWADMYMSRSGFLVARKLDGTLWVRGNNANGIAGVGFSGPTLTVFTQIGTDSDWAVLRGGFYGVAAIKDNGTLWTWGNNEGSSSALGLGAGVTYAMSPTQVGTDSDWVDVRLSPGGLIHMAALKANGTLWAVGRNGYGQCGQPRLTQTIVAQFTQVGTDTDWVAVMATTNGTLALKANGTLWGCGYNYRGLLGLGNTGSTLYSTMQQSPHGILFQSVVCAGDTCVGRSTGGVWYGWGSNDTWRLGTGDTLLGASLYTPLDLTPFLNPDIVSGGVWRGSVSWFSQPPVIYGISAPLHIEIRAATYTIGGPLSVVVNGTYYDISGGTRVIQRRSGVISGQIRLTTGPSTYTLSAPLSVEVVGVYTISAPVSVTVDVPPVQGETFVWSASAYVGKREEPPTNVTDRLTGTLKVDAEEGAARTAVFTIFAAGLTPLDPSTLVGGAVTLYFNRHYEGGATTSYTVFKGFVESVGVDLSLRTLELSCTDDLQNVVRRLIRTQVDALTRGNTFPTLEYSEAVFGPMPADMWEYLQARLEASGVVVDLSVGGVIRATSLSGTVAMTPAFTEATVIDQSMAVTLPSLSDVINSVMIEFDFRRYRCYEREATIAWSWSIIDGTDSYASGYQSPSIDSVLSAIEGTGWHADNITYTQSSAYVKVGAPAGHIEDNNWWVATTTNGCGSFVADLRHRHVQSFTEKYRIRADVPESIATYGRARRTIKGSMDSSWDYQSWEQDYTISVPAIPLGDDHVDYSGVEDRPAVENALRLMARMAKRMVYESHRTARVRFGTVCRPTADLIHYTAISTPVLSTQGKVSRVEHELDIDTGKAVTYLTISFAGVGAWGAEQVDSILDPPPTAPGWGPGEYDDGPWPIDDWEKHLPDLRTHVGAVRNHVFTDPPQGFLVNAPEKLSIVNLGTNVAVSVDNPYYNADWSFAETGFKIIMPGVFDNYRLDPPLKPVERFHTTVTSINNPITFFIGA